ncbi:MAG: hypothetical protein ACKOZZ_03100, partial [Bacteroidota bacterium]
MLLSFTHFKQRGMPTYANFNGQIMEASEVKLPVTDLSILRGYGIFDYFLVREKVAMFLDDYLARFYRSVDILGLNVPVTKLEMASQVRQLVSADN